jgi:hypothetical protein
MELKQVGKAVAVSLAALAAEAGMAWLRRRVERMQNAPVGTQQAHTPQTTQPAHPTTQIVPAQPATSQRNVTVWSQRVVQTWEQGDLIRQTVERTVWRRDG